MYQCGKSWWQLKSLLPRIYGCTSWALCEFSRTGSSCSYTVQWRRGEAWIRPSSVVQTSKCSRMRDAKPWQQSAMLWLYSHRAGPCWKPCSSAKLPFIFKISSAFASHPLVQREPGHCQVEEQLLACPRYFSPEPLCQNSPSTLSCVDAEITSSVTWVGRSCRRRQFSRWHCSPRDCTEAVLSTVSRGSTSSCSCFAEGVTTIHKADFLQLLASGDFWTVLPVCLRFPQRR